MNYSTQSSYFRRDKNRFFDAISGTRRDATLGEAWQSPGIPPFHYASVAKNYTLYERELEDLRSALGEQAEEDRRKFWLYSYYCCAMLQEYYRIYGEKKKAKEYRQKAHGIKKALDHNIHTAPRVPADEAAAGSQGNTPSFAAFVKNGFWEGIRGLRYTGEIRDWMGYLNLRRIYLVFFRLTLIEMFLKGSWTPLFNWIDTLLDKKTDLDYVIDIMQRPADLLTRLSVGIFAARFMLNAGIVLKHAWGTSEEKGETGLSLSERMWHEIDKRWAQLSNDAVWCLVNLGTGYPGLFPDWLTSRFTDFWTSVFSSPLDPSFFGLCVTCIFLGFDIWLLLRRHDWASQEYLVKKAQYHIEQEACRGKDWVAYHVLEQQLEALELKWKVTSASYCFNIAAAFVLLAGFSASLMVAPVLVSYCYLVSAVGVAMYMSESKYSDYKEKSLLLEAHQLRPRRGTPQAENDYDKAKNDCYEAQDDFLGTMVINTCMPFVMVALIAACWQAALVLAVSSAGYSIACAYSKAKEEKPDVLLDELPGFRFA